MPLAGVGLGLVAVFVAEGGVRERPLLAAAILAAAAAAGLAPSRFGLPLAIVLCAFEGLMLDFASSRALWWNEVFTVLLVARSLVVRRPSRRELITMAAVGIVYVGYAATGTSVSEAVWGAKVLLTSVVVVWALARCGGLGFREWRAVVRGFAVAAAASLVLAIWQRTKGVDGLSDLGLVYGERVREAAGGGVLRAFAGFTSPAPFSYMLAIAMCCWGGCLVRGGAGRRLAIELAWLPPAAAVGVFLSIDRTAVIGLAVSLVVIWALLPRRRFLAAAAACIAALAALAALAAVIATSAHFGGELASTARARAALWEEYLHDFRVFGEGPASAGSAYDKVIPPGWVTPLRVPNNWRIEYDRIELGSPSHTIVQSRVRPRPSIVVRAQASSLRIRRRLTVTVGTDPTTRSRRLARQILPVRGAVPLSIPIPGGRERQAAIRLVARPETAAARANRRKPRMYTGALANLVANPSFERGTAGWLTTSPDYWLLDGGTITSMRGPAVRGSTFARVAVEPGLVHRGVAHEFGVLTPGTYVASMYIAGVGGVVQVAFGESGPNSVTRVHAPNARWKRVVTPVWRATEKPAYLAIRTIDSTSLDLHLDAVQVERVPLTDYCDGSLDNCRWTGSPHLSWSSRGASTTLVRPLAAPGPKDPATIVKVRSSWLPMPQSPPFLVTIGPEELEVISISDITTYRVRRGANRTRPVSHPAGEMLYANVKRLVRRPPSMDEGALLARLGFRPRSEELAIVEDSRTPVLALRRLRMSGLPPPRTPAERVWQRWFERTPAALEGDGPGLVDNLYVNWLYQYGLLGLGLCALWLGSLIWPLTRPEKGPALCAAVGVGAFLAVAATAVSVWEESPTDLLAAVVFAHAYSEARRTLSSRAMSGG